MSTSKKEKKKLKRKQKMEELVKSEESDKFDIINLLNTERLDSKPNLGKFLQSYVKDIRVFNANKIQMYPTFKYEVSKVFVKFTDGHELIMDCNANKSPGFETPEFFMYYNCDEIELTKKREIEAVRVFFNWLFEFKFVY